MPETVSRRSTLVGLGAGTIGISFDSAAAEPACENALIVLTAGGLLDAPNRPSYHEMRDRFFSNRNLTFDKARSYAFSEIASLPQQSVFADAGAGHVLYGGPLLGDVLALAKPSPVAKTARLYALDGFAAELPLLDVETQRWVLAWQAAGKPFGLGDFGPFYAVRQLRQGEEKSEEENAKWVHSIFYVELAA